MPLPVPRLKTEWRLGGLTPTELARRVVARFGRDEVSGRAAGLSYYFLFSLFPLLIFLTALFGLFSSPQLMGRLMDSATGVMPKETVALLRRTLQQVVDARPGGGFASLGLLTSVWTASSGMDSLIAALNQAFETRSPRAWWRRRLIAIALTIGFSLASILALLFIGFGGPVANWTLAPLAALAAVGLLYRFGPGGRAGRHVLTPGAVFAVTAWGAASFGLRVYVARAANYNAVYGSIGGVIVLMLWFYLSALVILLGAEIDAEIVRAAER
jgi:membrane protein